MAKYLVPAVVLFSNAGHQKLTLRHRGWGGLGRQDLLSTWPALWPAKMQIDTAYIDGPFKHLESTWRFQDIDGGCEVAFDVDFEFRNKLLQGAAGLFFNEAMSRVVGAFEKRAETLYR